MAARKGKGASGQVLPLRFHEAPGPRMPITAWSEGKDTQRGDRVGWWKVAGDQKVERGEEQGEDLSEEQMKVLEEASRMLKRLKRS